MALIKSLVLSAFLLSIHVGPASARQDDQRLIPLFKKLSDTKNSTEARDIERNIWEIWMSSGSQTVDLLMFQGVQNMTLGRYRQALYLFTAVIEVDPGFAEAWNKRATVRFLVGDLTGSIEDVGRVLELEPRHFGAFAGLGQIFEHKKAPDQAISAFEKALRINPHMPMVLQKVRMLRLQIDGNKI